jgi:hypothetical protein
LVHWRIRLDNQAIALAAVKVLPVLVFDGQQVKLSFAEMLGREEGKGEYKASAVDRICIRIGEALKYSGCAGRDQRLMSNRG